MSDNPRTEPGALAPRQSKLHFLDLPGEIRNQIYELCTAAALADDWTEYIWYDAPNPRIRSTPDWTVPIPDMARTCRQVRAEYLSQELPKYEVEFCSQNPAVHWNEQLDDLFRKNVRQLTIVTHVRVALPEHLQLAHWDFTGSTKGPMILHASCWQGFDNDSRVKHVFAFQSRIGFGEPTLDNASRDLVAITLSELYAPSAIVYTDQLTFTVEPVVVGIDYLISIVDRLTKLSLQGR